MFNLSSSEKNRLEQRAPVQAATYESIKAKIDRGINRQTEGRKEVLDGLREMLETKAYLKKYKTIAAFVEHEYGKSPRWASHQLESLYAATDIHKEESALPPNHANASNKKEEAALKQVEKARQPQVEEPKEEEPEKPAVHSADEVKQPEPKAHTNGHVVKVNLENGKPKQMLMMWREMGESLIGRSINRADELNRQCPNPQFHAKLIAYLKSALAVLDDWKDSVK